MDNKLALFEEKQIRKTWKNNKWYFSIIDVVYVLTDSTDPKQYLKKIKSRDVEMQNNWGTICTLLEMTALDGKNRKIQMADTEEQDLPSVVLPNKKNIEISTNVGNIKLLFKGKFK